MCGSQCYLVKKSHSITRGILRVRNGFIILVREVIKKDKITALLQIHLFSYVSLSVSLPPYDDNHGYTEINKETIFLKSISYYSSILTDFPVLAGLRGFS